MMRVGPGRRENDVLEKVQDWWGREGVIPQVLTTPQKGQE